MPPLTLELRDTRLRFIRDQVRAISERPPHMTTSDQIACGLIPPSLCGGIAPHIVGRRDRFAQIIVRLRVQQRAGTNRRSRCVGVSFFITRKVREIRLEDTCFDERCSMFAASCSRRVRLASLPSRPSSARRPCLAISVLIIAGLCERL